MNNTNYDFHNTGYKLHLPVVPDASNPLTKEIVDFLDTKFGQTKADYFNPTTNGAEYYTPGYKVGRCSDALEDGKGMTIYGRQGNMDEMNALAQEIEKKFGTRLEQNIKKHNIIVTTADMPLTRNVSFRFAASRHGVPIYTAQGVKNGIEETFLGYNQTGCKSGALTKRLVTDVNGVKKVISSSAIMSISKGQDPLLKAFVEGDSTLQMIDSFGELYTGKIQNGKMPQFVMDGFTPEYLQKYPNLVKELPTRVQKGTETIVANMLEGVVKEGGKSALFRKGATPWFTKLEPETIDNAKKLLASYDPQIVQDLEDLSPQLTKNHPSLAVLNNTTPLSKMAGIDTSKIIAGQIHRQAVVKVPVTPNPSSTTNAIEEGMSKTKIGLIAAGVALVAASLYILCKNDKKEKVAQALQQNPQPLQKQTTFAQADSICNQNLMNNPCQSYLPQYMRPSMRL